MNLKNCSDQELIERFIGGERKCMEILIYRHKDNLYSYIYFKVNKSYIADDIFQDTIFKVITFLKNGTYSDKGKFLGWLIRIAHNIIIDYYRDEKKLSIYSNVDKDADIFNNKSFSDPTIEDKIIEEQIMEDVKSMITYLPEEQQEVVILRHYGNLTFKEISELTGVSINTSLGRMRYAIHNMKKMVEQRNIILTN